MLARLDENELDDAPRSATAETAAVEVSAARDVLARSRVALDEFGSQLLAITQQRAALQRTIAELCAELADQREGEADATAARTKAEEVAMAAAARADDAERVADAARDDARALRVARDAAVARRDDADVE